MDKRWVTMQRLTRDQAAIIGAFTGILTGPLEDMQAYAERVLGRPVWTHELADKSMPEALRDAARADFIAICAEDGESCK